MASKTEGIALLSMYNDEEEEEEEEEEAERGGGSGAGAEEEAGNGAEDEMMVDEDGAVLVSESGPEKTPPVPQSRTPVLPEEDLEYKTLASPVVPSVPTPTRAPTPKHQFLPPPVPSQSPMPAASPADGVEVRTSIKRSLTIVDYAHDETAMSPETEEGEILSGGRVVFGTDFQASIGIIEERTSPAITQTVTSTTQPTSPRHVEQPEDSTSEANTPADVLETEQEALPVDMDVEVSATVQQDLDPLSKFLPPPITVKCSEELQEKINKFLAYKRAGKSFNAALRNRKDYRNPDFLQHAVTYQDIDQIGTCFSKDVFDPHGYDKSDYYDAIEADMKREIERREQERKRSPKVDFVPGGTQPAIVLPAQKASTQISGVPLVAAGALQSASIAVDSLPRDGRHSKKSKWDKVDTDVKNPALPGQDAMSSVGVHAAILSAANAGAGYTAFAQQKRREAEEKKSSEKNFDKRS